VFVFLLVSRECSQGRERLTWSSVVPHDGYDVSAIDIYSCDRSQLVRESIEHRGVVERETEVVVK